MKNSNVKGIYPASTETKIIVPLVGDNVSAGFPSPAESYIEDQLDIAKYMIQHPAASYFIRVKGDSMIKVGIQDGDLLLVDRAVAYANGSIVLAVLNGEFLVKTLHINKGKFTLHPENDDYQDIKIEGDMVFEVWGVVTKMIRDFL